MVWQSQIRQEHIGLVPHLNRSCPNVACPRSILKVWSKSWSNILMHDLTECIICSNCCQYIVIHCLCNRAFTSLESMGEYVSIWIVPASCHKKASSLFRQLPIRSFPFIVTLNTCFSAFIARLILLISLSNSAFNAINKRPGRALWYY